MDSRHQQTTSLLRKLHLKKKRVVIITACILEVAGFLVFFLSLIFSMGGYTTNETIANQVFKMAFWAGMLGMAVATFGIITWAQKRVWMGNIHVCVSLIILGIGVYTAYYVSVLDMKVGYQKAPGLVICLQISLICYTFAAFFAFWASYATVFIIQEMREKEQVLTFQGTGTEMDKQRQTVTATKLQSTGEDTEDFGERPDEEKELLQQRTETVTNLQSTDEDTVDFGERPSEENELLTPQFTSAI